jgi:hypothetical protein
MSSNHNPQPDNNTRLEALFGALREREALLTDDEIRNIVRAEAARTSAPQKASRSVRFPQRFFTKKTMLISSVVAAVFASAVFLTNALVWKPSVPNNSLPKAERSSTSHNVPTRNSAQNPPNVATSVPAVINASKKNHAKTDDPVGTVLNTTGIHFLELTPLEAQRFGLFVNDTVVKSIEVAETIELPDSEEKKIIGFAIVSYSETATNIAIKNQVPKEMVFENPIKETPFLVTSSHSKDGIMEKRSYNPQTDSLIRNLGNAIALGFDVRKNKLLTLPTKNWGGYVVLWYRNTPEVIAALPDRYRIPLERELAAAQKYSSLCEIPNREEREELERVIAGKPFLETWRSCAGALSAKSIAPNPAQNEATVRFALSVPRSVSAALHDIRGQHLETLHTAQNFGTGEHTLSVNLTKHIAGMYLLVLTTQQGEQTVQRVMIEK